MISHIKLIKVIGGNLLLLSFNLGLVSLVFIALLYYQWSDQRIVFYGTVITFIISFVMEYGYRNIKKREFTKIEFLTPKK